MYLNYKNDELKELKEKFTMILKEEKQKIFISKIDSMIEKYYKLQKPKY